METPMAKDYTAREPGLVAVRLDLTPDHRDRLRVLAAENGRTMSKYVRLLVEREIDQKKPPKKKAKESQE
jgi:predicted DNA-binding protein